MVEQRDSIVNPGAEVIQVFLGFSGINPGVHALCALGIRDGRPHPRTRITAPATTNIQAAWECAALALERLAGRPAVLFTTLQCVRGMEEPDDWRLDGHPTRQAVQARLASTGCAVRYVVKGEAPPWMEKAQEEARRAYRAWQQTARETP